MMNDGPTEEQVQQLLKGETNIEKMKSGVPEEKRIFRNKYCDREMLTAEEAIDLINTLSGMLLVHECNK